MVFDPGTVKRIGNLRHRTCTAVCQPFAGCCFFIIDPCRWLQIQHDRRCLADLVDREDRRTRYISRRMDENQIHIFFIEVTARFLPFLFTVNKTVINFSYNEFAILDQPFTQSGKLSPVMLQPHRVNPDPWFFHFFSYSHFNLLLIF